MSKPRLPAADRDEYVITVEEFYGPQRRTFLRDVVEHGRVYTVVDMRRGPRECPGVPVAKMIPIGGIDIPVDNAGCVTWTVS